MPCHHTLAEYLHAHIDGCGSAAEAEEPLPVGLLWPGDARQTPGGKLRVIGSRFTLRSGWTMASFARAP